MRKKQKLNNWLPFHIREGTTVMELLVACSLASSMMFTATTLIVRNGQLQRDMYYDRVALDELTNHFDLLQQQEVSELEASMQQLVLSERGARSLPNARLTGTQRTVGVARHVVLQLSWDGPGRRDNPLRLATWIYPKSASDPLGLENGD